MKLSAKERSRLLSRYGEWAIVTGASSGIGLELSTLLAEAGFHLILNARDQDRLQAVEKDLTRQFGVQVLSVAADLADKQGVNRLIEAADGRQIGLLVNNAGYGTSGLFTDSTLHEEIAMLRVNNEAVLSLTHHFAQRFSRQQRGGIIFLSSLVAFQGVPYAAHYAATKAYIQSFAEALAVELKPFQVDVLSAAPGPVESGFGRRSNMRMGRGLSTEQVGVPILHALGRKTFVLPGLLSKVLVYSLRTVPRAMKIRIMKMIMGGFTRHQRLAPASGSHYSER